MALTKTLLQAYEFQKSEIVKKFWNIGSGIWNSEYAIWNVQSGIWNLYPGI